MGRRSLRPRVPDFLWPIREPQGLRFYKNISVDTPLDLQLQLCHCECDWSRVTCHSQLKKAASSPSGRKADFSFEFYLVTLSQNEGADSLLSPDQQISHKHPPFSTNVADASPAGPERSDPALPQRPPI